MLSTAAVVEVVVVMVVLYFFVCVPGTDDRSPLRHVDLSRQI